MGVRNGVIAALLLSGASSAFAADEQPICPDRPSKSTGPCTVPPGKWQIETGLVDWSRQSDSGVTTQSVVWGNSAVKFGISSKADLEIWLTPLETLSIHGAGLDEHHSSFGDTLLRVKYELSSDSAPVQIAVDPFVKLPTANHQLGNGKIEAGLLVPIQATLGKTGLTLSLDPELDLLANQEGSGHHLAMSQVFNLGAPLSEKFNVSAELWGQWDWDPLGTGRQYSADVAFAYLPNKNLQLDWGANFGLNRATPGIELYTGVSFRF